MSKENIFTNNICFDTNTIISYLFFIEPEHEVIRGFINKNINHNLYFTKKVYDECENVFAQKQLFLEKIIYDIIGFLEQDHSNIFNQKQLTDSFFKLNNVYEYKNHIIKNNEIKDILLIIWNKFCDENMDAFNLSQIFFNYQNYLFSSLLEHKNEIYDNLILINAHQYQHSSIKSELLKNNSHEEDNEIILDLYEYHLNNELNFIFITFDKSFYIALKKCAFDFLIKICGYQDIKRRLIS